MDAITPGYSPSLPLWTHQAKGLEELRRNEAFALLMEPRTGKTATILAEFGELEMQGTLKSMLVIAPAGCYLGWKDDAPKHLASELNARMQIYDWSARKDKAADKEELRKFLEYQGPRILLVNVEALSKVIRARDLCVKFLKQGPAMMVVDESTCIKGYAAKRTKFIISIRQLACRRRILSGLPSPQGPLDLWSQFYFLDPMILRLFTFIEFRRDYAVMVRKPFGPKGRMVDIVTGYKNIDRLADRIRPYSYRVKLEDCYDLPPKIYMRRDVEMTPEQKRIYESILAFAVAHLGEQEYVTATLVITQILRLHQVICGHTTSDNGEQISIPENRTGQLLELLEEYPETTKAVIWCSYDADVRKVTKALTEKYGTVSRFWGGNMATREEEERQFKTDPARRFMVATPAAGGRGKTWDMADLNVYYSSTPNLEHRFQSEERTQIKGKSNSVAYVDLMCRGSVEEKIVQALRAKIDISTTINGDNYRSWLI
jgi:SNF2 family DNA or RNA helicase